MCSQSDWYKQCQAVGGLFLAVPLLYGGDQPLFHAFPLLVTDCECCTFCMLACAANYDWEHVVSFVTFLLVCVCMHLCGCSLLQAPESYKNVTDVVETCELNWNCRCVVPPPCPGHCHLSCYHPSPLVWLFLTIVMSMCGFVGVCMFVCALHICWGFLLIVLFTMTFSAGHAAGISKMAIKLRPIAVIKG